MKWRSGPPPSKGWWIASFSGCTDLLRWWNGHRWSKPSLKVHSAEEAARRALVADISCRAIKWLPRPKSWPERSKT